MKTIMDPVPAFAFLRSRYDNELRSSILESHYDFVRRPKSAHGLRSVSPNLSDISSADAASADGAQERNFDHGRWRSLEE